MGNTSVLLLASNSMAMDPRGFPTIAVFTSNGYSQKDFNLVDQAAKEHFVHVCKH